MRRLRPALWIIGCLSLSVGSIGCVATGSRTFPASATTPGNFTQTPWNPSLGLRNPAANATPSVELASTKSTAPNAGGSTVLKHFPGLARYPGYLATWTKSPQTPASTPIAQPAPTDEAIADAELPAEEEEIPVLRVHVRFDPVEEEPSPKPIVADAPKNNPKPEKAVEKRVSYEVESPSADPKTSARPTDFQIDEADAPPRRRDAHTDDPRPKRKPFVALTDVSPRLLFPKTYFDSSADRRVDSQPEPEVRQATWRPLDAKPAVASSKPRQRGIVRRTWERFANRFAPRPPIER